MVLPYTLLWHASYFMSYYTFYALFTTAPFLLLGFYNFLGFPTFLDKSIDPNLRNLFSIVLFRWPYRNIQAITCLNDFCYYACYFHLCFLILILSLLDFVHDQFSSSFLRTFLSSYQLLCFVMSYMFYRYVLNFLVISSCHTIYLV